MMKYKTLFAAVRRVSLSNTRITTTNYHHAVTTAGGVRTLSAYHRTGHGFDTISTSGMRSAVRRGDMRLPSPPQVRCVRRRHITAAPVRLAGDTVRRHCRHLPRFDSIRRQSLPIACACRLASVRVPNITSAPSRRHDLPAADGRRLPYRLTMAAPVVIPAAPPLPMAQVSTAAGVSMIQLNHHGRRGRLLAVGISRRCPDDDFTPRMSGGWLRWLPTARAMVRPLPPAPLHSPVSPAVIVGRYLRRVAGVTASPCPA